MILPEELLKVPLFAAMAPDLRARIASRSADLSVDAGEWVVHEGSSSYFWTVLEGEVEVVKRFGSETIQVTYFEPGEYFGETPLMLGADSYAAVRSLTAARLMRTDAADFHLMLTASPEAGAEIASTIVRRIDARREFYVNSSMTQAAIVGDRYDLACHDIRDFLSRNQIAYEWLDPSDPVMPRACHPLRLTPSAIRWSSSRTESGSTSRRRASWPKD